MDHIEYVFTMLDWNNPIDIQLKGRKLAQEIKDFSVFLQPNTPYFNKNIWENCAIILSEKTDIELSLYLQDLLEWIQDLNWPGALCILDRLRDYKDKNYLKIIKNKCECQAIIMQDDVWLENLHLL